MNELNISNDALSDSTELNSRLAEDGYLFFRGLLNADRLLRLRREMLTQMQQAGWLVAGSDPMDGSANDGQPPNE